MSTRRQLSGGSVPAPTAAAAGEMAVEEFGYGLGPPTGILVLRYPPCGVVPDFPETRNDYVHQCFWSPDGVLAVRRGATQTHLGADEALWVRRGVVAEVVALDVQTVFRICVRQAPPRLSQTAAATIPFDEIARSALVGIARTGVDDEQGLAAREVILGQLETAAAAQVSFRATERGPASDVAAALLRNPADPTSQQAWAERLHVSTKTLQRDFERQYGASFTAWRSRLRLRASVPMLRRSSVTETAHRVGYASASAYVAAFTREFGETPGRHVERLTAPRAG